MDENAIEQKQSEIQNMLKEVQDASVTIENYTKWFNKIKENRRIIITYIGSVNNERRDIINKIRDMKETQRYKDYIDKDIIPKEMYDLQIRNIRLFSNAYSWMSTLSEMYDMVFKKIDDVFDVAKAYTNKRGALELMEQEIRERNKMNLEQVQHLTTMTTDIVNNKISFLEQRMESTIQMLVSKIGEQSKPLIGVRNEPVKVQFATKDEPASITTVKKETPKEETDEERRKRLFREPKDNIPIDTSAIDRAFAEAKQNKKSNSADIERALSMGDIDGED